jgi:Tfp pilus assembly protein PilZ
MPASPNANRRRLPRFRLHASVRFHAPSCGGEGSISNLSEGGLSIQAEQQPRVGDSVRVEFLRTQRHIEVEGEVRWTSHGAAKEPGEFGIQIHSATEQYHELMTVVARRWASRRTDADREKRLAPQLPVSVPVIVELGDLSHEALLCDISLSGGRIEQTSFHPPIGAEVVLTFTFSLHAPAFEVIARVARYTEPSGFAVQFEALDTGLKEVLESAARHARSLTSGR